MTAQKRFVFRSLQIILLWPFMLKKPIVEEPMLCVSDIARVIQADSAELFERLPRKRKIGENLLRNGAGFPYTGIGEHFSPLSAVMVGLRRMRTPLAEELLQSLQLHNWED